jgi:hypothetical protein
MLLDHGFPVRATAVDPAAGRRGDRIDVRMSGSGRNQPSPPSGRRGSFTPESGLAAGADQLGAFSIAHKVEPTFNRHKVVPMPRGRFGKRRQIAVAVVVYLAERIIDIFCREKRRRLHRDPTALAKRKGLDRCN